MNYELQKSILKLDVLFFNVRDASQHADCMAHTVEPIYFKH